MIHGWWLPCGPFAQRAISRDSPLGVSEKLRVEQLYGIRNSNTEMALALDGLEACGTRSFPDHRFEVEFSESRMAL